MRISIDIGGRKLEAAAFDRDGELHLRCRIPTPRGDYAATVDAIAHLVEPIESELGQRCTLGLGIPGNISAASGLIKNAYSSPFNRRPLDRNLAARFDRPVRLMNDANCLALSEARGGVAAGAKTVFDKVLSTRCGSGIVVHGELLTDTAAVSGELDDNPLPWPEDEETPGLLCCYGKHGCIETFISGNGLYHQQATYVGEQLGAKEIVARSEKGDILSISSMEHCESRLARAFAANINVIDSDIIVLGEGISNYSRLYNTPPPQWPNWVLSDRVTTKSRLPWIGDSSRVRGAACLWPEGVAL